MFPGTSLSVGMLVQAYCPDKDARPSEECSAGASPVRLREALPIGQLPGRIEQKSLVTHPTPATLSEKPA